jgi:transcription antitermination protein NusB
LYFQKHKVLYFRMVNRRLLRVKAFQQLYAYYTQERAQYQLAFDELGNIFQPDLSLMIAKEDQAPKLEGLKKLAEIQLNELFKSIPTEETIPKEANDAAHSAFRVYHQEQRKIASRLQKEMLNEVENIYAQYIKILFYLQSLSAIAFWDENRRLLENPIKTSLLGKNKILAILPKWVDLQNEIKKNQIGWSEDEENRLKKVFIEGILPDEKFIEYLPNAGKSFEDDLEMIKYILKTFILKHPSMAEYFEEKDLNWQLNKDVVKSLSTKTFKIEALEDLELQNIALQWDDDSVFFEQLFKFVVEEDKNLETWIGDQTQNWDNDRLAMTDLILLKMAIAEMINFSSIPVKVSINEYIELAKDYSTPKSGQFINGVLDVVSARLIKENIIKKSGRGLIDIANK